MCIIYIELYCMLIIALSLHYHCIIIALSLHYHCIIIALSLHYHCSIIALSLHYHCIIIRIPVCMFNTILRFVLHYTYESFFVQKGGWRRCWAGRPLPDRLFFTSDAGPTSRTPEEQMLGNVNSVIVTVYTCSLGQKSHRVTGSSIKFSC